MIDLVEVFMLPIELLFSHIIVYSVIAPLPLLVFTTIVSFFLANRLIASMIPKKEALKLPIVQTITEEDEREAREILGMTKAV